MSSAQLKVKGGKLLRLSLELDRGVVTRARLTGDFFIHPEEGIVPLEKALTELPEDTEPEVVRGRLEDVVREEGLQVIGFEPADLAALFREAMR